MSIIPWKCGPRKGKVVLRTVAVVTYNHKHAIGEPDVVIVEYVCMVQHTCHVPIHLQLATNKPCAHAEAHGLWAREMAHCMHSNGRIIIVVVVNQ